MILLWFLLGIALIFGIAKYNESNKLFWTLLLSFIIGIAGAKVVLDTTKSNKVESGKSFQGNSTQISVENVALFSEYMPTTTDEVVTAQVSVGQSAIFEQNEELFTTSMILGKSRDQPTTPICFDTS